jgi:hypothetical protein
VIRPVSRQVVAAIQQHERKATLDLAVSSANAPSQPQ